MLEKERVSLLFWLLARVKILIRAGKFKKKEPILMLKIGSW
jgi:hypothetical protein